MVFSYFENRDKISRHLDFSIIQTKLQFANSLLHYVHSKLIYEKMNMLQKNKTQQVGSRIYLDYAASTPLSDVTKELVSKMLNEHANPSSIHSEGMRMRSQIENARKRTAQVLGALPSEVYFTSGSTEGLNIAIRGIVSKAKEEFIQPHVITSAIEHPAIIETLKDLEKKGEVNVDYLVPCDDGAVSSFDFQKALRKETVLVALSLVNSEIGTLLPHKESVRELRRFRRNVTGKKYPYFLLDATQASLYYSLNVQKLSADILVLDGSKMGALAGSGLLYIRRDVSVAPILSGGGQEKGLRPGTQNFLGIETLATALEHAQVEFLANNKKTKKLCLGFLEKLKTNLVSVVINGSLENRSPHIISLCFTGLDAEWLVLQLDAAGVSVSRGSACKSGKGNESEVLSIINPECKKSSIRFSFGSQTTEAEVEKAVKIITRLVSSGVSFC
jgi:cysteine desulfurase